MPEDSRVLIAGLYHETHTFLSGRTDLADFVVKSGEELADSAGDLSPLGGVLAFARSAGWNVVPVLDMRAMPGPLVSDGAVQFFRSRLTETMRSAGPFDGVLLILHGAMVSESSDDVEGDVLGLIRQELGGRRTPVCAVLDLHCNSTEAMARHADALVAYRENPHVDARDSAVNAARILDRLMRSGLVAKTVRKSAGVMWPPTGTGTAEEPLRLLEVTARRIERRCDSILAVNVLPGFSFADTLDTGVTFCATTTGDADEAMNELDILVALTREHRQSGNRLDPPVDEVVRKLGRHSRGPVIFAEPSDNIGAGTSGAGTGLLRAFIQYSVPNSVVCINDPAAVQRVCAIQPGARIRTAVGSRATALDPEPLEMEVKLLSTSDGRFRLENPRSHLASMMGDQIDMGRCAVVRYRDIRILLTSRRTPPFDLGQLRSQGIEPTQAFAIGVKAAVAHRAAYAPIAEAMYTVDTPGPCSSDLRRYPYVRVRRPVYPLDS